MQQSLTTIRVFRRLKFSIKWSYTFAQRLQGSWMSYFLIQWWSFQVVRDKRTGKTKGFGFVSFANPSDLALAFKEMNGK